MASDVSKKATEAWSGIVATADEVAEWAKTVRDTIGQYAKNFDADEMWEIASAASKAGQDVIVMVLK